MKPKTALKKLIAPAILLTFLVIPMLYFDTMARDFGSNVINTIILVAKYGISILVWLSLSWFLIRLLDFVFWEWTLSYRLKITVPKILKDITAGIIFIIIAILGGIFNIPVTGLLATSGVVGLVVGLALQSMIADVFSGIIINIEQPFKIGDFVELDDGFIGKVVEINWRTTHVLSLFGIMSVVPNGKISQMIVKNYDKPQKGYWLSIELHLSFEVPVDRALRILLAAAQSINKSSEAVIREINELGVKYHIYFGVPQFEGFYHIRSDYLAKISKHLYQAGLTPVYPKQDIYFDNMPKRQLDERKDQKGLISRISIFEPLSDEELELIVSKVDLKHIKAEETIVNQGDESDSLFIVVEGLLYVFIKMEGREGDVHVGQISSGEFFGELSLLTGENRAATIVSITDCVLYEIKKEDISPILDSRPELLKFFSKLLAEREIHTMESVKKLDERERLQEQQSLANQILKKMKSFFSVK